MEREFSYHCSLLWKLVRRHGWSKMVGVAELARDAPVSDEEKARRVARTELAGKEYVGYRQDTDEIWLTGPPHDSVAEDLVECGFSPIQIRATFGDYQDTV
jgi:hypothetical protein